MAITRDRDMQNPIWRRKRFLSNAVFCGLDLPELMPSLRNYLRVGYAWFRRAMPCPSGVPRPLQKCNPSGGCLSPTKQRVAFVASTGATDGQISENKCAQLWYRVFSTRLIAWYSAVASCCMKEVVDVQE